MSSKRKLDPRSARTKAWLIEALLTLIEEKPYKKISIAEITDQAGLARPTFYLHYRSKDDLLLSYLDQLFEAFYKEIEADLLKTEINYPAATKIFEQVQEHKKTFEVILSANTNQILLERFRSYTLKVFIRFIEKNDLPANLSPHINYVADHLAGAILGMISDWVEHGQTESPETMGRIFYALTQPGLTNVLIHGALDSIAS